MQIDVFSLLPETMRAYLNSSILGRAQAAGLVSVGLHNIRDYATDKHRTTDDEPYGGGGGMVMKPEPVFAALEAVLGDELGRQPIILLTPQGEVFNQEVARDLAQESRIALLCGRYEGIDERIRQHLATREVSIGDYVLTGGELPAMVLIDAVMRLIPKVLGDAEATGKDSHAEGLLEYPHYTRPAIFRDWEVPPVLRSGDHARIAAWRRAQSIMRTLVTRPDLLQHVQLDAHDQAILDALREEFPSDKD